MHLNVCKLASISVKAQCDKITFGTQTASHKAAQTKHKQSGPRLNIKTIFPRYGDSHVWDKTVERPSYL